MNLALMRVNLKLSRWAIAAWTIFLALYAVFIDYLYPTAKTAYMTEGLVQYIQSMPESLKVAMGLTDEDLFRQLFAGQGPSLGTFQGVEYLAWWPVVVGIYALLLGSGALAKEADRGTLELLLSQPIARWKVVASKAAVLLAIVVALAASTWAGMALGLPLTQGAELDMVRLAGAISQAALLALVIGSYSLLLSCLFLEPGKATIAAGGLMAASYMLNLLAPVLGSWGWLQKLSLFYYYRPMQVLVHGEFPLSSLALFLGVGLSCFLAALAVFQRRKAVM